MKLTIKTRNRAKKKLRNLWSASNKKLLRKLACPLKCKRYKFKNRMIKVNHQLREF